MNKEHGIMKNHVKSIKNSMKRLGCMLILSAIILSISTAVTSENSAANIVKTWKAGWNLGNSLDVIDYKRSGSPTYYETLWGNPLTTKKVFESVKTAGFDVVRIPVTWYDHTDQAGNIDAEWMNRVKTVVNMAMDTGLYCIINVHHDVGETAWIKADPDEKEIMQQRLQKLWQQIAVSFQEYDDRLLFEGFNEILDQKNSWTDPSDEELQVVNDLNQLFVDTVRATGGKNSNRILVVNPYASSTVLNVLRAFEVPHDSVENRIIVSVHFYSNNAKDIDAMFSRVQNKFLDLEIPVIIGECGMRRDACKDEHSNSERIEYAENIFGKAREYNIGCLWWDDGGIYDSSDDIDNYALINRKNGTWYDKELIQRIVHYNLHQ